MYRWSLIFLPQPHANVDGCHGEEHNIEKQSVALVVAFDILYNIYK